MWRKLTCYKQTLCSTCFSCRKLHTFSFVVQIQVLSMCPELLINTFIQKHSWYIGKSCQGVLLHMLSGGFQMCFQIYSFLIIAEMLARIKLYVWSELYTCAFGKSSFNICSCFPMCLPYSVFAFVSHPKFSCAHCTIIQAVIKSLPFFFSSFSV